ncbi:MAG TPA: efflux RND transporter periplasmic adaptor subunit [Gemmatimonadales bacterium]|jgi:RND family efflux transporter MFP subunit
MRYRVVSSWLLLWSAGCGGGADLSTPPPPPEVTVAEVRAEELAEWDEYQGVFQAVDRVDVRPRVSGYLIRVAFTEGTEVRKGAVLFEIDPEPYQATLDQRKADLARSRARLSLTERDAKRGEGMVAAQAISQEEMDTRLTLVAEARAAVAAAEAAVRAAELDLGYTKVRSPVDGRTSRAEVTEGNLVTGGPGEPTELTTVVSLDPIYVYFEGDESAYLRYAHLDRTGERASSRRAANPVQIGLADEEGFPHHGRMDFVDNRLDRETGTIRARAVVPNPDRLFTPGMFARVRLIGSGVRRVTVIPEVAVSTDQDRKFVFVFNRDSSTVAYRPVTLGRQVDGQRRIIREGLKPGEQIVVNGFARIRPGVRVKATAASADSTAGSDSAAAAPVTPGSSP